MEALIIIGIMIGGSILVGLLGTLAESSGVLSEEINKIISEKSEQQKMDDLVFRYNRAQMNYDSKYNGGKRRK